MIVGATALLVVLALAGWLGLFSRVTVVGRSALLPLPGGLREVYDGTYPCRGSGNIGWEYRYLVVSGDEGRLGGLLDQHLQARGFVVGPSSDEWRRLVARKGNVQVSTGPLSDYFEMPRSFQRGPIESRVAEAARDERGPLALVELAPIAKQCEV